MSDHNDGFSASFGSSLGAAATYGTAPAASAPGSVAKDITTAQFMSEVIETSKNQLVIVDFWAPWCGPCKQLAPALEKVVSERHGDVKLVKMDIDREPQIAQQMQIQSIPAVVAFKGGRPVDAFMGAKPESEIRAFIDKNAGKSDLGARIDEALVEADQAFSAGELELAANIYISILQAMPDNLRALVGLGMVHLNNDDLQSARSAFEAISERDRKDPLATGLLAAIELQEQASNLGDLQELVAAVEADGNNHQARFDLAIGYNARGKHEEAADELLKIIRKDRLWNDDGAKKQLLQFFEAWGPMHPATKSARRQLSSLLFS